MIYNLPQRTGRTLLLLSLEVVEEDGTFLGLFTPVLDNDTRAVDDLAGVSFAVELAYSIPLAPNP